MIKKTALLLLLIFTLNVTSVFAAVGIEDYFERGWNEEYAGGETVSDYISPYKNEIKIVTDFGFMFKDANGNFDETENLLYSDFADMMFCLMGGGYAKLENLSEVGNYVTTDYAVEAMAEMLGYGYLQKTLNTDLWNLAVRRDVLKGLELKRNTYITREQMAKLLVNCFEAERVVFNGNSYSISETSTMLSDMDIEVVEGFMSAAGNTNLYSTEVLKQDAVKIEGKNYNVGDTDAISYLGTFVKAYVYDINGDCVINAICDDEAKRDCSIIVYADNIQNMTDTYIEYYEEGSERYFKKNYPSSATLIYNGKYMGTAESVASQHRQPDNGLVKLIDSKNSGRYDVICVTDYKIGVVELVSANKIVLKNNAGSITYDNYYDELNIYVEGVLAKASELREWYVLSIAESHDKTICNIYATSSRFSAKVIKASSTADGEYEFEGGRKVKLSPDFFGSITVGKTYTVYLTTDGKIAAVGAPESGAKRNYGYLRACAMDDAPFARTAKFRILDIATGEWSTVPAEGKIKFNDGASMPDDGTTGKEVPSSMVLCKELVKKLSGKPQLVVYEKDAATGTLKSITTAKDSSKTGVVDDNVFTFNRSHTKEGPEAMDDWKVANGDYMFSYYHLGSSPYQLIVPSDRTLEERYEVYSMAGYTGTLYAPFDIYDADSSRMFNGVAVCYSDTIERAVHESAKMVVKDVQKTLTEDGTIVYQLTNVQGKVYYVDPEDTNAFLTSSVLYESSGLGPYTITSADDIEVGDVLCYNNDGRMYLTAIRKDLSLNDLKDDSFFSYRKGTVREDPATMYDYGVVVKNPTGAPHIALISYGDGTDYTYTRPRRVDKVYIYNREKKTFYEGSSAKSAIVPGDKVFTTSGFYYINSIAIIVE